MCIRDRGRLVNNEEGLWVELLSTQDSHMLSGISYGDVLVEIPPQADVKTAQLLNVYPLAGALD